MTRYLSLVVCLFAGCNIPDPAGPLIVRPDDLAKSYRDKPDVADTAYTGQLIQLPADRCRQDHTRLTWSLGTDPKSPPVVILEFAGDAPQPCAGLWIQGRCSGRVDDDVKRELAGFNFTVVVRECRVVRAP